MDLGQDSNVLLSPQTEQRVPEIAISKLIRVNIVLKSPNPPFGGRSDLVLIHPTLSF